MLLALPTAHCVLLTTYPLTAYHSLLRPYPKQAGSRLPQPSTDGKGPLGLPKLPFIKERVPGEPAAGGAPGKQLKALL